MDTFDATAASLSSFDNGGDAHSFVDYFQQQQDNQQQHSNNGNGFNGVQYAGLSAQGLRDQQQSSGNTAATGAFGAQTNADDSSSTSTLLRSSTSPSSRSQILANNNGMQTDSASTTVDSPNSLYFGVPTSSSTSSVAPASGKSAHASNAAAAAAGVGSPHSLHPIAATPIRHNSLPFEQQQQQQHLSSMGRPIAGPSSRQMSMGGVGTNGVTSSPASPHLNAMRPPTMMMGGQGGGQDANAASASSPTGSDFLNPNSSISQSPSPLRTSVPFTTSPDHSTTTSPTTLRHDDGFGVQGSSPNRSQTMPSPSLHQTPGGLPGRSNSQSVGGSDDKNSSSTKFVHKLFRMVSDPEYQHLISWNASGTSVVVTNFDEFSKEVLGKHFKHSNFSSFIRQLNMYGFYKVNKTPRGQRHTVETQVWEFSHPKFIRGRHDLLDEIRRKALDSEHARVEARDLHYNVSVGHMQLRQQVDEHQYRLEEMFEVNLALRQMVLGLRDSLANVLEWVKANNGGQLPFESRMPMADLPPTPMMHPFMAERPSPMPHSYFSPNPAMGGGMMGHQDLMGGPGAGGQGDGGPSIFVTEPGFGQGPGQPHDVFSMHAMGQVSPLASRRPSNSSQVSEHMDRNDGSGGSGGPPRMTIDTSLAAAQNAAVLGMGNPGLGVMGLGGGPMNGEMQMAINTPLPPSPAVPQHPHMMGGGSGNSGSASPYATMENSPFLGASPSMPSFGGQGYFGHLPPAQQQQQHTFTQQTGGAPPNGVMGGGGGGDDDNSMLVPNAKAMRTQIKRTASNAGSQQMMMDAAAAALNAGGGGHQQKRKSPGV